MPLLDYSLRLLGLSEAIARWLESIAKLETERREKIARYAEEVAATLARAATALALMERGGTPSARREAVRELGRIAGYVEDIVAALQDDLDGRKLAGVKRRLDQIAGRQPVLQAVQSADTARIERLLEAEGYFRALADGLRT